MTATSYLDACLETFLRQASIPIPPDDLDWGEFYELLRRHRLVGLFAAKSKQAKDLWPASFIGKIRVTRYSALTVSDDYLAALEKILAAFREQNIPVIVLKGWAIIKELYQGDPSQRVYSDADLLVSPENVQKAIAALVEQGYVQNNEPHPGFYERYAIHLSFFAPERLPNSSTRVVIELHWKLMHVPYYNRYIDVTEIFTRARRITLKQEEVLVLNPEDHLVYFCGHMILQHGNDHLRVREYELAAWVLRYKDDINWDRVYKTAKTWRLLLAVRLGFERINKLWPAILPSELLSWAQEIRPGIGERLIYELDRHDSFPLRIIAVVISLPLSERVRYVFELLFPTKDYLKKRYDAAAHQSWPSLYFEHMKVGWNHIWGMVRSKTIKH